MASLSELRNAFNDSGFRNNVQVVLTIAAYETSNDVTNYPTVTADSVLQADRLEWAVRVITSTLVESEKIMKLMIGANEAVPIANIIGADKATIETAIKAQIDFLAVHDKPVVVAP